MKIRYERATMEHLKFASQIFELIKIEAEKGEMLPRTLEEIEASIQDGRTIVALTPDEQLAAFQSIDPPWEGTDLVELRSGITVPEFRRQGIGTRIRQETTKLAAERHPDLRILTLSNPPAARLYQEFRSVPKEELPGILWTICADCPEQSQFPNCHCQALIYDQHLA